MENILSRVENLEEKVGSGNQNILDLIFPVGRGFIDFTGTDYSHYLGFVWERELVGMTAVGIDNSQSEFNSIGKMGGSKTVTLTTSQMPAHTHTFSASAHTHTLNGHTHSFSATTSNSGAHTHTGRWKAMDSVSASGGSYLVRRISNSDSYDGTDQVANSNGAHTHTVSGTTGGNSGNTNSVSIKGTNSNTGGGTSHSNLQPYKVVAYWKRIA